MKNNNLILISLFLLITMLSIGSVAAADMGEINIEDNNGEISSDSSVIQSEISDSNFNDNLTDLLDSNIDNKYLDTEKNNNEKFNLKSNQISSTITVDGSAYNQMSDSSIQNAIDSASAGDTIIITGSSYVHCHFIIDKKLTIISPVGTSMSPCPSNRKGSGAIGIFYISPEGSGTVINGFNLTNDYGENDDYGILIRGASDVEILNCTITSNEGDGIRIENAENTLIEDCIIKDSNIGINISSSSKTTITMNNLTNNKLCGVNIGEKNENTTIHTNNITYNQHSGIDLYSGDYVYILNNFIAYNQNSKSASGAGIYVNSNISKVEIKGNYIRQNGQYGVLNDYRVRNMDATKGAEELEINNNNYYLGHTERLTYHIEYSKYAGGPFIYDSENDTYIYVGDGNGDYDIGKTVVYLAYAFYRDETICGATLYKAPSTTWGESVYRLDLSPMTQVKKGVYSVSIVDKDGKVASDISSIYVTFYLNKENNKAEPQEGDIYKTVLMQNGTATVDFTDAEFKESNNTIIASFPGLYSSYTTNPYVKFDLDDEDIPGSFKNTAIDANNTSLVPSSGKSIVAKLMDENGNPIANESLSFKISGLSTTYTRTTDENGEAKLKISLSAEKTYNVSISFKGSESYNKSSKTIALTIKKQSPEIISSDMAFNPSSGEQFTARLMDANNEPIEGSTVTFKISKKTYSRTTDENGTAKLTINLAKEGKYSVTINSPKTSQYTEASKTNTITIKTGSNQVTISSSDKTYVPKSGEYFTVKLSDSNGNPLANKAISFTVSSKTYKRTTDENGTAKLTINLVKEAKYPITTKFAGDEVYSSQSKQNTITIKKASPKLISYDRTYINKAGQYFSAKLLDGDGKPLKGESIVFALNKNNYTRTTNDEGLALLKINLAKDSKITTKFAGNSQYSQASNANTIKISNEIEKAYIDKDLANDEIQRIINEVEENLDIEFLGEEYNDISLSVNKTLLIYTNSNTTLNGKGASPVFSLEADNIGISFFNINVNSTDGEGYGIIINNSKEAIIRENTISNILNQDLIDDYKNGSESMPGYGISIINSLNPTIIENEISLFESGIYTEDSNGSHMEANKISKNNYGIKYGFGNANTEIMNNEIRDSVGWYVMDVPEGPKGYGLYFNNSAVNVTIRENNISNNYLGISFDANNSTGIVVTKNLIADNSLEGIRFNAPYDLAENAVEPLITDNAIYRNAKGPSLMILGEMSANPFGIYGPGQWNDSLKLKIDPNWYGVNELRTWDNDTGIVGVGTMCPRIKTSTIKFISLEYIGPMTYEIKFYKNDTLASDLASFDIYATLNRQTDKKTEVHFLVENGIGTFSFPKENYLSSNNTIEISVGSLINVVDRIYTVVYTYEVPQNETAV